MKFLFLLPLLLCSCFPVRNYSFIEPESQSSRVVVYQDGAITCKIDLRPEVLQRMTVRTELHASPPERFRVEDCVVHVRCADDNRLLPRIFNYELYSWYVGSGVSDTTLKHGYAELPDTSKFRDPRYTIVQQFHRGDCEHVVVTLNLRLRDRLTGVVLTIAETRLFNLTSKVEIEVFRGH